MRVMNKLNLKIKINPLNKQNFKASSSLVPMSNECRLPGTYIISLDKASHGSSHHIPGFDTTYIDRTQSLRTNTFQRGLLQPGECFFTKNNV